MSFLGLGADKSNSLRRSRSYGALSHRPQGAAPQGQIRRILYLSAPIGTLAGHWNSEYLDQFEKISRKRNDDLGVGGLLLFYAPYFFEVLEGFPDAVGNLFQLMRRDPRFGKVILLEDVHCTERVYTDWGVHRLDRDQVPVMIPILLKQVVSAFLSMWHHLPRSASDLLLQGKDPRTQPPVQQEVVISFIKLVGVRVLQSEPALFRYIADVMGTFVDACVKNVESSGGEVAKFLNGGCMAYWPVHRAAAAYAALRGIRSHLEFVRLRESSDSPLSLLHVRAGVHCGRALLCSAGTGKADFTLLGDCINVASRLISQASVIGANLVVSAAACALMGPEVEERLIDLGPQHLKGRADPVHCYRDADEAPDVEEILTCMRDLACKVGCQSPPSRPVREYRSLSTNHRPPIFDHTLGDPGAPDSGLVGDDPRVPRSVGCLGFARRAFRCCCRKDAAPAAPQLITLTYISTATSLISDADIARLHEQSARSNRREGLTSDLLLLNGTFAQKVEGPAPAVGALWKRLKKDPRHTQVVIAHLAPITTRSCLQPLHATLMDAHDLGVLEVLPTLLQQLARTFQCLETYVPFPILRCITAGRNPSSLPPVQVDLVMLAADVVCFTRLSEGCELIEVWQMCTTFIDLCTREIEAAGGQVIQLIGDCVQAYFPPAAARPAMLAAQHIVRQCSSGHRKLHRLDCRSMLTCGVGLDYGSVVMAHCGSPDIANFMVVGEVSRRVLEVEASTRGCGRRIVVTKPMADLLPPDYPLVPVESPGGADRVKCFALAGTQWELDLPATEAAIECFHASCRLARGQEVTALELPFTSRRDSQPPTSSESPLQDNSSSAAPPALLVSAPSSVANWILTSVGP